MSPKEELDPYLNREHALVKHKLFERYFKRFIMILGLKRQNLAYVDAFAGPWFSSDDSYSDTSFGRAISAIESCSITLATQHNKRVRFRSLLIEADVSAFSELRDFANRSTRQSSTIEALNRRFEESVQEISEWIRPGEKTFVLIDPKAYKGLISPAVLSPLLKNPDVELLINYMWQFINLAIGHVNNEKHESNLTDLYGPGYSKFSALPAGEKEKALICEYRKRLVEESGIRGDARVRAASFPVQYADRCGTKYYLVYVTHNPSGLIAFSEASDEALEDQKEVQFFVGQKKREEKTGILDMFDELHGGIVDLPTREDVWIEALPSTGSCIVVDQTFWANMLERHECLPSQLQLGLKKLIDRKVVEVVGATTRRKKNFVNWKNSETVRRLK